MAVDDTEITTLVADTPDERRQGLKEVTDVPDGADGMLFAYAEPSVVTYGMFEVVVPLDIWFFDPEGVLIGSAEMEPCPVEPCTAYASPGAVSWVLETVAGEFDFPPGSVLSGAPSGESG